MAVSGFRWSALFVLLVAFIFSIPVTAASLNSRGSAYQRVAQAPFKNGHWVDIWATMPQLTEPGNLPPAPYVRNILIACPLMNMNPEMSN